MDANQQTLALPAYEHVTINVGLGKGSGHTIKTVSHRLRVMARLLPQIFEQGYMSQLYLTPHHVWFGEPMIVVQGTFKDVHLSLNLWQGLLDAEQDCVAIYSHDTEQGMLFGPKADEWGGFNINLFTFLGDQP